MTGFVAYFGSHRLNLRTGIPAEANQVSEINLAEGQIGLWGGSVGDVHFFEEPNITALTLCGCIYGIDGMPALASQRDACLFIMKAIGECNSLAEVSVLAARIKGSFSLFYHNAKSGALFCISDRLASRPLWTQWTKGGWIVSSHVIAAALTARVHRLSPVGLGAFLLYGGPLDPAHSLVDGITAVPQGTVMRLLPNGRVDCDKWYTFRHKPDNKVSYSEWVDLISERLVSASQRLARDCRRPAVFFSGGTDSRLLAAAMKAGGLSPVLLTLSDGPNLETRVASAAARALGLEHHIIKRDPHWYLRTLRRAVYETGGVYLWTHGHFAAAAQEAMGRYGVDAFLLGDFSEAYSKLFCDTDKANSIWTTPEFVKAHDSIRLPLYRPSPRERTLTVLKRNVRDEVDHLLRQQIAQRYEKVRDLADDPRIVGDLAFRWESVGLLPTFFMFLDLRSAAAERNIMFDPEVHDLLQRIPSNIRNGRNLGAQVIKRLAPRAAWVVNSNSLVPMFWPPVLHKSAKRIKPWLGKVRRAALGKTHRTTGSWQERGHLYCVDPQWRASVQLVIDRLDRFDDELFDRDELRNVCLNLLEGDLDCAGAFEKLLQLELLAEMLQEAGATVVTDGDLCSVPGKELSL